MLRRLEIDVANSTTGEMIYSYHRDTSSTRVAVACFDKVVRALKRRIEFEESVCMTVSYHPLQAREQDMFNSNVNLNYF